MAGFVHILPKTGLKQPSIYLNRIHSKKCWVVSTKKNQVKKCTVESES